MRLYKFTLTNQLIDRTELSPSYMTNIVQQLKKKNPISLFNPNFHYRFHKIPPLVC